MIRVWYSVTLFVSAMLLFFVQPMMAKMILPLLGGAPAVWNTCLVFFQLSLLLGYLYAHGVGQALGPRRQLLFHLAVLIVPFLTIPLLTLPMTLEGGASLSPNARPALAVLDTLGLASFLQEPPDPSRPIFWLLMLLIVSVSIPFFVVSATAPLLQHWFANTGLPDAKDPYFLYAASNSGSIFALLAYPILIEPNLRLANQASLWSIGYGLLAALIGLCAVVQWRSSAGYGSNIPAPEESFPTADPESRPTLGRRLRWLMLAAIPTSLLLGVTTFLSTNVAAVPLLWIIPLTLYLLTFVLVFSRIQLISNASVGRILPFVILIQTFAFAFDLKRGAWIMFLLHLGCFFLTALYCHGRLAADRPDPRYLTEFYLWLSGGGVVGGLLNVLIAPLVFNSLVEYPLALVLACMFLPRFERGARESSRIDSGHLRKPARRGRGHEASIANRGSKIEKMSEPSCNPPTSILNPQSSLTITWSDLWLPLGLGLLMVILVLGLQVARIDALWLHAMLLLGLPAAICYGFIGRPVRFALGVGALLLVGGISRDVLHTHEVHQERSFFGVLTVVDKQDDGDPSVTFRTFVHGNTNHGVQNRNPEHHRDPLAYYFRTGPIGQLFDSLADDPCKRRVAVLGLGAGALACYAEKDQDWTFLEIDPAVDSIARQYFTFLEDAQNRGVHVQVKIGDGRLSLANMPDHSFDLIFADAFSSDAVPVHLLTRQALALYLRKLADGGLIIFNITNRYLDLEPELGALAAQAGLVCLSCEEEESNFPKSERQEGKTASHWVVMARREGDLGRLMNSPAWRTVPADHRAEWTDDYSNLLGVFRW
jgi:SAM-dependent methyltransferase